MEETSCLYLFNTKRFVFRQKIGRPYLVVVKELVWTQADLSLSLSLSSERQSTVTM